MERFEWQGVEVLKHWPIYEQDSCGGAFHRRILAFIAQNRETLCVNLLVQSTSISVQRFGNSEYLCDTK